MLEVNYGCRPCRPFTSEASCVTCLESRLIIAKCVRDFKLNQQNDAHEKAEDVFDLFSVEDSGAAEDLAA